MSSIAKKPGGLVLRGSGAEDRDREIDACEKLLRNGHPIFVTIDEIVSVDEIKGHLIVDAYGLKSGVRITLQQSPGFTAQRNALRTAISGNDWIAPLVKGDVVGFEKSYVDAANNRVMVGAIGVRVHDKLNGKVQVMSAMTRPSKAVVNKKGALQTGLITDGAKAVVVNSVDLLRKAFEQIENERWPGGNPGFLLRDGDGNAQLFIRTPELSFDQFVEDLEHNGSAPAADYLLEVIPAWSLPMGSQQVSKDVNPKQETGKGVIGKFTDQYFMDKSIGMLPSLVVVAEEEEWSFGAKTGKIIPVISSMMPLDRRKPVALSRIPSNKQAFGGKPNTINKLYDEQTLEKMEQERIERRGYPNPEPSKPTSSKFGHRKSTDASDGADYDEEERRTTPRFSFAKR